MKRPAESKLYRTQGLIAKHIEGIPKTNSLGHVAADSNNFA
jgi:hypothetical protein